MPETDYADIRGFNYQPSYGTCGLELWQKFDADRIRYEFERGQQLFPQMNAVRFWLDFHGWQREGKRFLNNLDTAVGIFHEFGCRTMPVIFNRWHDNILDYGGIYIDHFTHRKGGRGGMWDPMREYGRQVATQHAGDERLLMWDLCNEPQFGREQYDRGLPEARAEYEWLAEVRDTVRAADATTPISIGSHGGNHTLWEPLMDVIQVHPYFIGEDEESFDRNVAEMVEFARAKGKPLIVGECCWGSLDDAERAHKIEVSLGTFNKYHIGWLAYLLWTSGIADAHGPEVGPVGWPQNLAFIMPDGSLRPRHEVVYQYM